MAITTACYHETVSQPKAAMVARHGRAVWLNAAHLAIVSAAARRAQRRMLMELDSRQLADVGITHTEAINEARKPFWR